MILNKFLQKRYIIARICVIFCVIFCIAQGGAMAQEPDSNIYRGDAEYLAALGVIEKWNDDDEWLSENILRGEMAQLACGMLGVANVADGVEATQVFDDVEKNSLYIDYINYLSVLELISGNGESFYPKDYLTYMQMAKIVAGVLGYKAEAEAKGGYPLGYMSVIRKLGIFAGVEDFEAYVTRVQAYEIVAEAMEVNIMSYVGGDDVAGKYRVYDGTNMLNTYHDTEIVRGIVTANQYTSLYSANGVDEGRIRIGDTTYMTELSDANMYLGYSVKGYIKGAEKLIYIKDDNFNNSLSVISENIGTGTNKAEFVYYDGENAEKKKIARIDNNASVIFNERYCAKIYTNVVTDDDLKPASGNVFLLDNNDDNIYDVVFISSYDIYVADSVSEANKKIRPKYTTDEIDCDVKEFILTDVTGNAIELSQIAEWNIIAVAKSKDKELMHVVVLTNSVSGAISRENDEAVTINGNEYKISPFFNETESELVVGKAGVFYLDIENKIVAVDYSATADLYGYLISASITGALENDLYIKLFSEIGEVKTYECAEKITFNKNSDNVRLDASAMYEKLLENGAIKNQLIKFSINDDKKISSVELASSTPSYDKFSLGFESDDAYYVVGKINYKYFMPDDVKIFSVPDDKMAEDDYLMVSKKGITGNEEYSVQLYDIDKSNHVKAAILNVGNSEAVNAGEYSMAVTSVNEAVNKNGDIIRLVCGYVKGVYTEYEVADDTMIPIDADTWGYSGVQLRDLKCGDIIQVNKNAFGEVNKFRIIFRPDSSVKYMLKNQAKNTSESQEIIGHFTLSANYAEVVRRTSKAIIHDKANEKILATGGLAYAPVVYIYDADARENLIVGTMDDIEAGDMLLVLYNWSSPREYIVYRY